MGREDFEEFRPGTFRRKFKRRLGLFIDGIGLDRATRRLERKVDLARLVTGLSAGVTPEVARYYTLIPHEDDARQFAFLDAVERAGLKVIVKRLPPKGVKRQVAMDVHIATDLINFSVGVFDEAQRKTSNGHANGHVEQGENVPAGDTGEVHTDLSPSDLLERIRNGDQNIKRMAVIVCPSRELSYAIHQCHRLGVETSLADFGLYGSSDGWKGVDRWIDLSTSETIWRG